MIVRETARLALDEPAAGLNAEDVFAVLSRVAPALIPRKAGFIDHRYEPVTFALRDAVKDLRLASDLFKSNGSATPLTTRTKELFEKAGETSGALDLSAISTLYEKSSANG